MKIEPVWHSVNPMQMATKSALENHDRKKIVVKLSDNRICFIDDISGSDSIVEVFFLP